MLGCQIFRLFFFCLRLPDLLPFAGFLGFVFLGLFLFRPEEEDEEFLLDLRFPLRPDPVWLKYERAMFFKAETDRFLTDSFKGISSVFRSDTIS